MIRSRSEGFSVGIKVSARSTGFILSVAVTALALVPGLAGTASGVIGPRWSMPNARRAAVSAADTAHSILSAHLDEQSVPSAENPGSDPALEATAPDVNPGPSAEWDRVPGDGAASSSGNPPKGGTPPALTATGAPNAQSGLSTNPVPVVVAAPPHSPPGPIDTAATAMHAGLHPSVANLTIKPAPGQPPPGRPIASGTGFDSGTRGKSERLDRRRPGRADGEAASAGPPPGARPRVQFKSGPDSRYGFA